MTIKKCPKCGKEFSDMAKSCPNCSYSMKKTGKFLKSKVLFLLCIFAILLISSSVYLIYYLNRPSYKLIKAIKSGELITAQTIYDESVKKYNDQLDQTYDGILEYLPELVSGLAKGDSDYYDVKEIIGFVQKNFPEVDLTTYEENISKINISKAYFHIAEEQNEKKEFLKAIEGYENVCELDSEYYKRAQENIIECRKKYANEIFKKINSVAEDNLKNEYIQISEEINSQSWLLDNEEVSNAFNALKLRVKAEVIQPILDKVDKYTERSEYGKAIGLLYQNMKYEVDNILSNKMAVVKQQRISD